MLSFGSINKNKFKVNEHLYLAVPVLLAFFLRITVISQYGLSEDEVRKALAVDSYLAGDFTANPSHPAFMKLWITLSVLIFGQTEFALRLPNVIISSFTVIPIYLIGRELYDELTGYLASLIWSVNISALAFSTTAKEDSFLTFFWLLSIYYFIKIRKEDRYLKHLGITLGLGAASKYTFVILILMFMVMYIILKKNNYKYPDISKIVKSTLLWGFTVFAIFNFPIFIPATIYSMLDLLADAGPSHSGYFMMGRLFRTRPWYFLLLYLFVKSTLPFLIAVVTGLFVCFKQKTYANFMLVTWIFIPLLIYSAVPWGYTRYLSVIIPGLSIMAVRGVLSLIDKIPNDINFNFSQKKFHLTNKTKRIFGILVIFLILIHSLLAAFGSTPYYRMYVNELGGGEEKIGYYFPEDSVYDYFMREAILYVNEIAPLNSVIPTVVPLIGQYYGREDLSFVPLGDLPLEISSIKILEISYIIVQVSRIYFENIDFVNFLVDNLIPVKVFNIGNNDVVEIFHL